MTKTYFEVNQYFTQHYLPMEFFLQQVTNTPQYPTLIIKGDKK